MNLRLMILILKITNSNTENNKADANKCVCLIYWKENAKMQLMKFVTRDTKDKKQNSCMVYNKQTNYI